MTIRAIVPSLLGQQTMLLHEEIAVIRYHAGTAMTENAFPKLDALEVSVVGPGEGETDNYEKKGRGKHYDFQCLIYHDITL